MENKKSNSFTKQALDLRSNIRIIISFQTEAKKHENKKEMNSLGISFLRLRNLRFTSFHSESCQKTPQNR